MKILEKPFSSENFAVNWRRLMFQGALILVFGATISLSSILNTEAVILSAKGFSWLPLSGFMVFIMGLQECLEAFFSKISREFHQNLQVGILDAVIGALIFFSISGDPQRLSMMISAFLIVRGLVRISLVQALRLPHSIATTIFGVTAIILGLSLFLEWPTTQAWYMSLCLNIEIAFRGWAMITFALWVRQKEV